MKKKRITLQADQQLPGIHKATLKQILEAEGRKPLVGGNQPMQHGGLFGESHLEATLF